MVTNMISQLQESFPLRRAAGSFEISFKKWLRVVTTVQLLVTFSMSCQIFTSILFPSLKNIQEDLPKKKVVFYVGISSVSMKETEHYMATWGYDFYLLVLKESRRENFQHSKIKFVSPRGHVVLLGRPAKSIHNYI